MKRFYKIFSAIVFIVLVCSLYSCGSGNAEENKKKEITRSFIAAHKAFVRTHPAQEKLFMKFTDAINALDDNRTIVIDTKELDSLLTFAREVNAKRRQLVNENVAQDSAILYHDKANDLINATDSFYQKFPGLIQILQETGEDRYDRYVQLMSDPLTRMRTAQEKYQEASDEMTKKYGIKISN
jgi:hypothetical protein